jgi:hypothetical protein
METFVNGIFSRMKKKMKYTALHESPMVRGPPKKRARKSRKLLPARWAEL